MAHKPHSLLMLGGGDGWHFRQLSQACKRAAVPFQNATYQSLNNTITADGNVTHSSAGPIDQQQAVLCRTMPAGTLQQITFRLATLHRLIGDNVVVVNSPSSLEIAIDKYASLARIAALDLPVPETIVAQSVREALDAFETLGGDCIIKPIFGGEGRGVMRVSDPEMARTVLQTLQQLGVVLYVQKFIPPGGADTRILRIGDHYHVLRRTNRDDFRTNNLHGGQCERIELTPWHEDLARRVTESIGLEMGSVDLIDDDSPSGQGYRMVEVNGIPGWQAAQNVTPESIAGQMVDYVVDRHRSTHSRPTTHRAQTAVASQ